MIRFTFMLSAGFLAFNIANAQSHSNLKGHTAKNYKPWKQKARTGAVTVKIDKPRVIGPAFKNKKVGQTGGATVDISSDLLSRERVTGPGFKNRKVWKKVNSQYE